MYRRRTFRRRIARGTVHFKFTKVSEVQVPNSVTSTWGGSFRPGDFEEYKQLAPCFEAFKFNRIRIRVIPFQNVSNNSTSACPSYTMVPWHKGGSVQAKFETYLSIDRAKVYRQTERGRMSFVPNVLVTAGGDDAKHTFETTVWKPRISRVADIEELPRIYCGLIAFQGDPSFEGRTTTFNIITDVYVTAINQSHFNP